MKYKNIEFELCDINNNEISNIRYSIRKSFLCVKINIYYDELFFEQVNQNVKLLASKLNQGRANNSENRASEEIEQDALTGYLSEYSCRIMLIERYGGKFESKQIDNNQIDILMPNGKTIEVRSSCIRNGTRFALFYKGATDGYFDIIGPYTNKYKPCEIIKDYYMRILIPEDKPVFCEKWKTHKNVVLYLVGGATKDMMMSEKAIKYKHLNSQEQKNNSNETEYRVIPIEKSLDAWQLFKCIENQDNLAPKKEFNYLES